MSTGPSFSERYHEATKYTPESVRRPTSLDPAAQPPPFKEWHQARRTPLEGQSALRPAKAPAPGDPLDARILGSVLFHTYGVTRVHEVPGGTAHFRAAPSAGALYPTEVYVAVRSVEGLPDGIHHYQGRDHSLDLCWEGDFWGDLRALAFSHPALESSRAVLFLTAVYGRSTWRYRDRGYRRVLLDTGHVAGNAVLAAWAHGRSAIPIADFHDEGVDSLLLLDPESEGALLLLALVDGASPPATVARGAGRSPVFTGEETPEEGTWVPRIHQVARIGSHNEAEIAEPTARTRIDAEEDVQPVGLSSAPLPGGLTVLDAIRRRRSTRTFRVAPIPIDALGRILAHAYPRPGSGDPEAHIAPHLLETWVVAAEVEGLPAGVHHYDPVAHSLRLVRRGNPRRALFQCCLMQELGRDCALAVVHTLDLPRAVARFGERAYRYGHLESGLLGERLDLAALRLGFGASGIGGFFDDFVNDLLLLPPEHAVTYLTTIGVPA